MKFFTEGQKLFFISRKIKVGGLYDMSSGYTAYPDTSMTDGTYCSLEPNQRFACYFIVDEKLTDLGLLKCHLFSQKTDSVIDGTVYVTESSLSARSMIGAAFLFLTCSLFFIIYNIFNKLKSRLKKKTT